MRACSTEGERRPLADRHECPVDRPPALVQRLRELRRIIEAYAQDAISAFGGGWLALTDREWIEQNAASSVPLIGMATRRIVALDLCDESVTRAAKLLSMAHGSLSDWLARRSLPGKAGMQTKSRRRTAS